MTVLVEHNKPSLAQVADTFLIPLTHFSAIALSGEEQSQYLQGQVTCDVNALTANSLMNGAHCNAKGKVFSCFRLFNRDNKHILLQPKSTLTASLSELKKFGVFAKVDIQACDDLAFYALIGSNASTIITNKFGQVPNSSTPVIQLEQTTLVYLPGNIDRYLLIDSADALHALAKSLDLPIYDHSLWDLLEIKLGFPLMTNTDQEYVPQMLNIQAIDGISFTKGCYLGQETVARMQYLGRNKKALFILSGKLDNNLSDLVIEKQLGDNWRKAGDVTSYYQADNGEILIQAVLANDTDQTTNLRIKDHHQPLTLVDLPYSITQE